MNLQRRAGKNPVMLLCVRDLKDMMAERCIGVDHSDPSLGRALCIPAANVRGGRGDAVAEVITSEGMPAKLTRHDICDEYSLMAPTTHLYAHYEQDAKDIRQRAARHLERAA